MTRNVGRSRIFGDLFDFQYEKHRNEDLETLSRVTARHLVIMFHAFDQLQSMRPEDKNGIINHFLESEVLEKSGWGKRRGVNLDSLKNGIKKHSRIESGQFSMKTSEEVQISEYSSRSAVVSSGR